MSYFLECEESFDSSHFLRGHKGKCKNLHGHRWRVKYRLKAEELIKEGSSRAMIIDFGDIKKIIKAYFDDFDHALILEDDIAGASEKELNFIKACEEMEFKIVKVPFRTTAENMSKYFYEELEKLLLKVNNEKNYKVDYIEVYETPNNAAIYREE
ncbi:MAG: 6-pyruvoyl trahydropterin synthase family protein [Sarcina sp.]